MLFAKATFIPKGSKLVQGLWSSWFKFKGQFKPKGEVRFYEALLPHDSIWFSAFLPDIDRVDLGRAHKMAKIGFISWGHLFEDNQMLNFAGLQVILNFSGPCLRILQARVELLMHRFPWFRNSASGIKLIHTGCWSNGAPPLPLPNLDQSSGNLIPVLNAKWGISWSLKQWVYRFKCIWAFAPAAKFSALMWLILHKAVWTSYKAKQIGISNGLCPRCRVVDEDVEHLFFRCSHNKPFLTLLWLCCRTCHPQPLGWREIALGECSRLDLLLWNRLRSLYLFHVWKHRNSFVYGNQADDFLYLFREGILREALQVKRQTHGENMDCCNLIQDMKGLPWQKWGSYLAKRHSLARDFMHFDILSATQAWF